MDERLEKCQINMTMLWKTSSYLSLKVLAGILENEGERSLSEVFRMREGLILVSPLKEWVKESKSPTSYIPLVNNPEIENAHVVLPVQILWSPITWQSKIHVVNVSDTELNMKYEKIHMDENCNFSMEDRFLAGRYCSKEKDIF